ncbi:hypothetical protein B0H12DRAFT_650443 [Mycena haematopus]|nr:hypothetical protein B0H12DRAFT_650443 [Mycena haematopus]
MRKPRRHRIPHFLHLRRRTPTLQTPITHLHRLPRNHPHRPRPQTRRLRIHRMRNLHRRIGQTVRCVSAQGRAVCEARLGVGGGPQTAGLVHGDERVAGAGRRRGGGAS